METGEHTRSNIKLSQTRIHFHNKIITAGLDAAAAWREEGFAHPFPSHVWERMFVLCRDSERTELPLRASPT